MSNKTANKIIIFGALLAVMFVFAYFPDNKASAQYTNCYYHAYQRCVGRDLYWYNSCGDQQEYVGFCSDNNQNSYNNNYNYNYNNSYTNCAYHSYKLCSGNSVYWYDSCGTQQDIFNNCSMSGQVCQYGQCVYSQQTQPQPQTYSSYVAYYKTACFGDTISWYDSFGVRSGLYKNCKDNNSCTVDTCSSNKCQNNIKCDGSTCPVGSEDYNSYCAVVTPPVASSNTPVATNQNNQNKIDLSVSFFVKHNQETSSQWQKQVQVGQNDKAYFMISVANNSSLQIDNVNVSANIPGGISSLGNLQLNGVSFSGDIVSGINIGSISPATSKSITFEGLTQSITVFSESQATAAVSVYGNTQYDSVLMDFSPDQAVASVSSTPVAPESGGFFKKWYLWIAGAVVLVALFIVVFKRLSSET